MEGGQGKDNNSCLLFIFMRSKKKSREAKRVCSRVSEMDSNKWTVTFSQCAAASEPSGGIWCFSADSLGRLAMQKVAPAVAKGAIVAFRASHLSPAHRRGSRHSDLGSKCTFSVHYKAPLPDPKHSAKEPSYRNASLHIISVLSWAPEI